VRLNVGDALVRLLREKIWSGVLKFLRLFGNCASGLLEEGRMKPQVPAMWISVSKERS